MNRVDFLVFLLSLPGTQWCVKCTFVIFVWTHNQQLEEKCSDVAVLLCSLHKTTVPWKVFFVVFLCLFKNKHLTSAHPEPWTGEAYKHMNGFILSHTIRSWSFSHRMLRSQYNAQHHLSILTYSKHFVTDRAVILNNKKPTLNYWEGPWEGAELQHQDARGT